MSEVEIPIMIVDRIEEGVAVLEGEGEWLDVPAAWLPVGAREGSLVRVDVRREVGTTRVAFSLDPDAQADRDAEVQRLRDAIHDGPDGDITL